MKLRALLDGKFVTIFMSLVTVFALIGDNLRAWWTLKDADPWFYGGLIFSMVMFTCEIILTTVVDHEFKYSFFFWLDIIATFSLIADIQWFLDAINLYILGGTPSYLTVNAFGDTTIASSLVNNMNKIFKSLRLIRLIRIIKLYKYFI